MKTVQQSAHPWHGVDAGPKSPEWVTAYIEIVPSDGVKYELDKDTGLLRVDRPQTFSSLCPTLYGFVPRTYCGKTVAQRAMETTGLENIEGDADPIDICVLSEKQFPHGNFLANVRPIGGFRMIDGNEADDKIIAVLQGDLTYGKFEELEQVPVAILDRLRHYFLSYKQLPTDGPRRVIIPETYDRAEAHQVIERCLVDYQVEILGKKPKRSKAAKPAAKAAKGGAAAKAPKVAKATKAVKAPPAAKDEATKTKTVRKVKPAPMLAAKVARKPAAKAKKA